MRKKIKKSKNKGFSLIEMVIAMFVASIMMLTVVASFAGVIKARRAAQIDQRNLENVRTAVERIAKNVRMSNLMAPAVSGDSARINIFNNSKQKCESYLISGNEILESECEPVSMSAINRCQANTSVCADGSFGAANGSPDDYVYTPITDAIVDSGSFYSDIPSGTEIGRVTMSFTTSSDTIQTTVSLRQY